MLTDNDIEYFYDEANVSDFAQGRLTRVVVKTHNDGQVDVYQTTSYRYDAAGRIIEQKIEDGISSTPRITTFSYDKEDNLTDITYPHTNSTQIRRTYNSFGQLEKIDQVLDPQTLLTRYEAAYSPTQLFQTIGKHVYNFNTSTFSSLGTLAEEQHNYSAYQMETYTGASIAYANTYPYQLRLQGHVGLSHRVYTTNAKFRVSGIDCKNSPNYFDQYCYPGNQQQSFSFDGLDRMIEGGTLTASSQARFAYQYDNNGNLTQLQDRNPGGQTWIIEYAQGTNQLTKRYQSGSTPPSTNQYEHAGDGKRTEDPYWSYLYHSNGRLAWMLIWVLLCSLLTITGVCAPPKRFSMAPERLPRWLRKPFIFTMLTATCSKNSRNTGVVISRTNIVRGCGVAEAQSLEK